MSTFLLGIILLAEAGPATPETAPVQFHGWIDAFYALNTNRPADGASFISGTGTTARRANELNVNAAALDVALDPRPVGVHLTLAFGSGPDVVHSGEPTGSATSKEIWRSVYQASISWTAPIGSGLLLEAGIYPSHIGYESFFSRDNWNYTRGWMGEFSPYYQVGVKASYAFDAAALWHAAGLYARMALSDLVAIALRAEYYDDRDGFFSGAAQVLRDGTATLDLRPAKQLIVKLEARHDIAGAAVFTSQRDASGKSTFSTTQTLGIVSAVASF